ncbi:MAG: hypothetical protein ACM3PP_03680 [Candidatus Saccharibacteria bacterium]
MRKQFVLILLISLLITGCTDTVSSNNNRNATGQHKPAKSSSNEWFSERYVQPVLELTGKKYFEDSKTVSKDDFLKIVNKPASFTYWNLLTKDGLILRYIFEFIDGYNDDDSKEIVYYDLSHDFSKDLYMTYISNGRSHTLLDYGRNEIAILPTDANGDLYIYKSFRLINGQNLRKFRLIGGYQYKKKYQAVFCDDQNLYICDADSMILKTKISLGDYRVLNGYTELNALVQDSEDMSVYLVNDKQNKLKKMILPSQKVEFDCTIDPLIKGRIKCAVPDGDIELYIASKVDDHYELYSTSDGGFRWIAKNETKFKNIDTVLPYAQNYRNWYVIIFDKERSVPVFKIDPGNAWPNLKEIKKN